MEDPENKTDSEAAGSSWEAERWRLGSPGSMFPDHNNKINAH